MRVRVDETRRDDSPGRIDNFYRTIVDCAYFGDSAVFNGNVGLTPRRPGAVDNGAVLYQQVVGHRRISVSSRCVVNIAIRTSAGERKRAALSVKFATSR